MLDLLNRMDVRVARVVIQVASHADRIALRRYPLLGFHRLLLVGQRPNVLLVDHIWSASGDRFPIMYRYC
jgi:hypothetical protein